MGQAKRFTIKQLVTVEPVIFFYAFALFMHQPVINQYIYSRIAKAKGFPYTTTKGSSCGNVTALNDTMKDLEKQVQSLSSYVHLGVVMFSSIPSLFTSLLIGSWTDSRGRKPALFLPALGSAIEAGLTILVMYMEWPVYVLFFGAAINGICGHFTTVITGVMAYIVDTTDESQRSLRLAVLELLTFVGGMVSQLTSGLWIKNHGFITPYWFILGCLIFSVLYTAFFVPESRLPSEMKEEKFRLFSWKGVKRIFRVYSTPREGGRCNLFLLTFGNGILSSISMGLGAVLTLFIIHTPLCFSPEWVGYFTAWRSLSIGLGAVFGIKILGMWISELTIAKTGIVTRFCSLIIIGFSKTKVQVYMGPLVGLLNGCSSPIFRGMLSRIVSEDEQGALFSAVACLETLSTFIGAFIFNTIYPASLKMDFPPLVFLIGAGLLILPFLFTWCLKNPMLLLSKKDRAQVVVGSYEKMEDVNVNSDPVSGSSNGTAVTDEICSSVRQRENSTYGTPDA
ncbi:proton-coupled folate transporter [Exaiptasia diaphana]|uniref:Proton-coupled folate transporter n=1 Tax=Exaiptasia diaphana TaxID=2652724 RepID=A0A913X1D5_EXADI|nr:proton-coupled folate transporter [Exaiptasia diaphana]KXJ16174.1 Proton-coupled folate transporter [Exaiptasia diaphana]